MMMGRPAGSRAALFLLLIATCDVQSAAQARSRVLGPTAATCVAAIGSAPPVPSAFSTSPVPSAFPNCDSLAHLASVTSVTCDGGSVLGQFALECTNSTESPLGSPLAPSLRLGGGSASVTIGSPAGIPLFSEAGDVLVAWEWNGRGGGVAMVVAVVGGEEGGTSEAPVGPRGPPTDSNEGNLVPLAGGPARAVSSKGGTGAGSPARQPQPTSAEQHASDLCSPTAAGGSTAGRQETDAPSTPSSDPTPGGSRRTRRRRRGRAGAKGKGKGKGKGKAGTVAAVATVDQFIRHAESGFFGDDEEADCPFVWDGDC